MKRVLLFIFLFVSLQIFAQHQDKVDFLSAKVLIVPDAEKNQIWGNVTYEFEVLEKVDSVFLDARNMEFFSVLINHKNVPHSINKNRVTINKRFKKGKYYTITLEYIAKPKQTVYFLGWDDEVSGNEQIWTQGQGKYTSHWLPSFDDMIEKVAFDLSITFDKEYPVIANGSLKGIEDQEPQALMWSYDMQKPMSSYLLAFVIGEYRKQELTSTSGIPIENYYYPKDSSRVEPTYRFTKEIFDFLEKEIGIPYPWQNYKQVPVHDFLYAGMENTGTTIFSGGYVIDSTAFIDKNYVNVNAHEMAHQWFGNLVTEKDGNHHWLHEGFATYYAYLAERELFGDEHYYWKLYDTANQLNELSEGGKGEALTNPKASSLTFYEKGAWALVMLREQVGGVAFKKGIQGYLDNFQFKNVTIADFLNEIGKSSGQDLTDFRDNWLEKTSFRTKEVNKYLSASSKRIKDIIDLEVRLSKLPEEQDSILRLFWNKHKSESYRSRLIHKYFDKLDQETMIEALNDSLIRVRQAVAINLKQVPVGLKSDFETLLKDQSYINKEYALLKLWSSFPEERSKYLDETKGAIGLPNKNIRLLWLTLAILTTDYEQNTTRNYIDELMGYTSSIHSWEIRMGAFQYLFEALGLNHTGLKNLFEATTHHSWQFKKYARSLLDELLKDSDYLVQIRKISKELNEVELRYLRTKIKIE
ncbi:M1 family metallopeptidase [Maribacter sp. HTCC2170]|uniref:M1 family metallopeptidase n=1 Tax=Maribacter sp. (strain HTCC2170 / KCCM 42371) TaxID=313603 RepID=UPI00006AFDC3|nr:M1 family metallopeptidase [Maribacter sp. HTCC2170]EAR01487.1 aminopeptidase [Maribacter sp. HTCC2170]